MQFTKPTDINYQISVVIEKIFNNGGRGGPGGHYHAVIVTGAGDHPQNAIVKTNLSNAGWTVHQIGGFYTVRSHEASLKAMRAVCEQIKKEYGI